MRPTCGWLASVRSSFYAFTFSRQVQRDCQCGESRETVTGDRLSWFCSCEASRLGAVSFSRVLVDNLKSTAKSAKGINEEPATTREGRDARQSNHICPFLRLKFRVVCSACFLSLFFFFLQSSQPPTRPAACHVKINRQSS